MGHRLKNPKNLLLRRSIFFLALLSLLNSAKPSPSNSTLDPKQLRALRSIGLRAHSDPCGLNSTSCDSSSPFRHIVSLRLSDCSTSGLRLSHAGLRALSPSLRSLSFLRCPIIPRLPFLPNLTSLSLVESALSGPLPPSIALLRSLRSLDLSSNSLSGPLPASIAAIPCLDSLNLRFNRFNGSLPLFLSRMPCLTRLFLDGNCFSGVFPFDPPFIRSLRAFTLSGNTLLCYNRSLVPPKLLAGKGVAPCDHYGLPATPPPGGTAAVDIDGDDLSDYEDYDGSEEDAKKKGGPSGAVLGVAIALSCLVFLVIFLACLSKLCR